MSTSKDTETMEMNRGSESMKNEPVTISRYWGWVSADMAAIPHHRSQCAVSEPSQPKEPKEEV